MTPGRKGLRVAAGYAGALVVASSAVLVRIALTNDDPAVLASSGMHAFADALLFAAIFAACAVVPTSMALVYLRPYRPFWVMLGGLSVAVSVTGPVAALVFAIGRSAVSSPLVSWGALAVLRILAAPLLALFFLICAGATPHRPARIAFFIATSLESLVSVYGGLVWFVALPSL